MKKINLLFLIIFLLFPYKSFSGSAGSSKRFTNSLGMEFVYIKPGTFMMGSPASESGRYNNEKQHKVTLTKGYYMQTTEVTIGQFRKYLKATGNEAGVQWDDDDCPINNNSSYSLSGNRFGKSNEQPMVEISWQAAKKFAKWLSGKEGKKYRLPTEAQWEYAARGGTKTAYCFGDNSDLLDDYAWYRNNSEGRTHKAGLKKPNKFGLYDMHGNVYEWCEDWLGDYPSGHVTDPRSPGSGSRPVLRGGSWISFARFCRSANRTIVTSFYAHNYCIGFRLAAF